MTKFKAVNDEGRKSTWPPAHGYISISAVTPTSHASCSMLSFFPPFFPCREGGGRREIRPHIQIQASTLHPQPPVPPPSVHIPLPATPQQQGPEPPPRSQSITGEREKKTEKGSGRRERMGGGGGGWKGLHEKGEVRKSESEMPWNLITERVVSGRGEEQIKLA